MRDEDDEELDESFQHADIPNTFRELRACMTCSLIKTFTQFYDTGCENCAFFKWPTTDSVWPSAPLPTSKVRLIPGIYAVSVSGELPDSIKRFLEDRNIPYRVQN
ncbi:hypothetical protein AM588_10011328 [Phytophthora nicotianae]|uniref:Spt4/RpoE2 zinc finger domain-containing protein n=1 Tax=Phytophthora nicotianae TaxID=4792 RepID=A0A0W8DSL7_PHYNI|nr:hypothetical protein AM588_10011328 [Phytophthora nicotianae]